MIRGTLIALMLLATPAKAETFYFSRNGQTWQMPMPADYWFKRPLVAPVVGPHLESAETTADLCSSIVDKYEDMGCAQVIPGYVCQLIINRDLPDDVREATTRHELAHCHGWPADHPVE